MARRRLSGASAPLELALRCLEGGEEDGPIDIAVGALWCIEVAAIIILLGAQVIAELQAGDDGDDHAGEVKI